MNKTQFLSPAPYYKVKNLKVTKKIKAFLKTLIFGYISIFILITEPLTTKERLNTLLLYLQNGKSNTLFSGQL